MIREAIQQIQEMTNRAAEIETRPWGVRKALVVVNGEMQVMDVPPPCRTHEVETLDDLVKLTERFGPITSPEAKPVVFIGDQYITAILDPSDRRDTVQMKLRISPQSQQLSRDNDGWSQKGLIRALRLKRLGEVTPNILPILERIEWNSAANAGAEIKHGKQSMGRSIKEECGTGDVQLPEEIVCHIPMFANGSLVWVKEDIKCQLFINHENQTFSINAMEGEIAQAFSRACDQIRNNLDASFTENADVVVGEP